MAQAAPESFKGRQRRAREDAILDAAEEVLRARGFQSMAMEDVAARVGIAKGTIYLHFASKDALLAALVARGIAALTASIDGLDPALPVLERLYQTMRELLCGASRHVGAAGLLGDELQEVRRVIASDPRCARLLASLRARLVALVEEGQGRGEIDPRQHPIAVVGAFFALSSPRGYRAMLAATELPPERLNASLIRLYLRGIARDPDAIPNGE